MLRRPLFSFRLGWHKAEEIIVQPKPIESSGFSRRRFLQFLGAAPVAVKLGVLDAFNPHRVYFDMGVVAQPEIRIATLDQLNAITQKYFDKVLADELFRPSPLYSLIRDAEIRNEMIARDIRPFWGGVRDDDGTILLPAGETDA